MIQVSPDLIIDLVVSDRSSNGCSRRNAHTHDDGNDTGGILCSDQRVQRIAAAGCFGDGRVLDESLILMDNDVDCHVSADANLALGWAADADPAADRNNARFRAVGILVAYRDLQQCHHPFPGPNF